jgi:ribosomal protein S27AE
MNKNITGSDLSRKRTCAECGGNLVNLADGVACDKCGLFEEDDSRSRELMNPTNNFLIL